LEARNLSDAELAFKEGMTLLCALAADKNNAQAQRDLAQVLKEVNVPKETFNCSLLISAN
jgi:hypothetical protein